MKLILIVIIILLAAAIYRLIPSVLIAKANSAYADGDTARAADYCKKAAALSGGKPQRKITYALMLMRMGDFKKAEEILNEIILFAKAKSNEKINARLIRCMAYQKTDRLDDALEDAEEIFDGYKNTMVYGLLGYLRQLKGGAETELCEEAYEYNSDDRDICDNLAVAYIRTGDVEKAEKITSELRAKFPTFVEGFYHSAQAAMLRGDIKASEEYLDAIADCRRTMLTTVSEEEIESLREEIKNA